MSTIKTETLSTPSNSTVPVDTVVNGTAKAWVNFNGTGTVAIRRAFNVSSITDNGTGDYTVNFTTAMPDANYVATVAAGGTGSLRFSNISGDTAQTSSLIRVSCGSATTTLIDLAFVEIAIFR